MKRSTAYACVPGAAGAPTTSGELMSDRGSMRILLTFDDGLRGSSLWAAEFLARHGIRATFFVVPGWIEAVSSANSGVPDVVTWADCEHFLNLDHLVESHSKSHADLGRCSRAQAQDEICSAKAMLIERLGVEGRAFAFPYNSTSRIAVQVAAEEHSCIRSGPERVSLGDWAVAPSMELTEDLLRELSAICVQTRGGTRTCVLQIHGFDGEGWMSMARTSFERFVKRARTAFRIEPYGAHSDDARGEFWTC